MPIADFILPEFDQEMANTRKVLERVPEDKFDWRPHDKSFTMCQLASHIANITAWTRDTLKADSYDVAPEGAEPFTTPQATSTAHLLEMFDANIAESRAAIESTNDETFHRNWTLQMAGKDLFAMPKIAVLRSFVLNHNVHHRAQLTVYFRICDVPVPALYGPSADEEAM